MSDEYYENNQKEYYIYYNDKNGEGHLEYVNPSNENKIVTYNDTNYDNNFNDTGYILVSLLFHFIAILFVFELGKSCYRSINRNRNNERLIINPNSNYYHNKVVIIEEISDEPCSICLEPLYDKEDLENNKPVISLRCNHMFHKECIDPWVINNKCCPLCKRNT